MKNLFLFALIVCIVGLIPLSYAQSDTESEEITDQDVAIGVIFFIGIPAAAVIIIVILIKKLPSGFHYLLKLTRSANKNEIAAISKSSEGD